MTDKLHLIRPMRTLSELPLLPVWVNTGHLVETAIHVMEGHKLPAVAVLEDRDIAGVLVLDAARVASRGSVVRAVMVPPRQVFHPSTPIAQVVQLFVRQNLTFAPVVSERGFEGLVTSSMLLSEAGRSSDPLTGLPWSDTLREWGCRQMQDGSEVAVVFFDVDDFGEYNRHHGHVVGDRVLVSVARYLESHITQGLDMLVRYGGDEFAICTLRRLPEAEAWALAMQRQAKHLYVPDAHSTPSLTFGIAGGKRTQERTETHYAATLDNLINLASRACMANKPSHKQAALAPQNEPPDRPLPTAPQIPSTVSEVLSVACPTDSSTPVVVTLTIKGAIGEGSAPRGGRSVALAVAKATAKAIESLEPGTLVEVDDLVLTESGEDRLVAVILRTRANGAERYAAATVPIGADLHESVAQAALQAYLNRVEANG